MVFNAIVAESFYPFLPVVFIPMVHPKPHRQSAPLQSRGFALLITITLLAFLVLLLVSLATLTRVETQVASNTQQISRARQNALMGLNIAIGQLQKFAGPDQRVTTTADLVASKDSAGNNYPPTIPYADPNGTNRINVATGGKYWTAVWGNSLATINYAAGPQTLQPASGNNAKRGITPTLLNWLVSGNESSSLALNGTQGGVTAGTAPVFLPSQTITPALTSTTTSTDTLQYPNSTPGVLLVGPASTSDGSAAGKTASIAAGNYVVAPLVTINVPASMVPGLGSAATATPVGKYAYWIGDEGVKARVNQQTGFQKTGQTSDEINSFITNQRSALEFVDSAASGSTPIGDTVFDVANSSTMAQLANLKASPQLSLLGSGGTFATVSKNRFHDLTFYSDSVLSDTYAGGLKKDLTADIADPSTTGNNPAGDRKRDTDPIFTPRINGDPGLPLWSHLRNWARTNPNSGGTKVDPTSTSARAASVYPNVIITSLGIDYYFDPITYSVPPAVPPDPANLGVIAEAKIMAAFYPLVVLQNPYSVTLAGKNYDVIMRLSANAKWTVEIDNNEDRNYKHLADLDLSTLTFSPFPTGAGSAPTSSYFRFRIVGEDIPPGQRHVYVLKSSYNNTKYIPGVSAPELERMNNGIGLTRKVVIEGPTITDSNIQSPHSRVRMKADMNSSKPPSVSATGLPSTKASVLLTEIDAFPNADWATITSTAGMSRWYQALFDIYLMPRRYTYGGVFFTPVGKAVTTIIRADGTEVEDVSMITSEVAGGVSIGDYITSRVNNKATGAFRMSPVLDGSDWYSSNYQVGLPFPHTIRHIATGSIRAPFIHASYEELDSPTPNGSARSLNSSYGAVIMGAVITGNTAEDSGGSTHPGIGRGGEGFYVYSTGYPGGPSTSSTPGGAAPPNQTTVILWDLLDSPDRLLSLGQLQHVAFSRYGFQSSYLFGNSYADMRVWRNKVFTDQNLSGANAEVTAPTGTGYPLYDTSWLLNRSLWDRYFVSGVPSTWKQADIDQGTPLPNARMTYYSRTGARPSLNNIHYASGPNNAFDNASSNLLVSGGFNINSTSEQAWRAVIAATYRIPLNAAYAGANDNVDTAIPYPRFTHNLAVAGDPVYKDLLVTMRPDPVVGAANFVVSGTTNRSIPSAGASSLGINFYSGNRGLYLNNPDMPANPSPTIVVNELARSIVNEIRQRGPFLSLADFVNRPLTATTDPAGIKGVLQAGIDNMNPAVAQVNPWIYGYAENNLRTMLGTDGNGNYVYAWNVPGHLNEHAAGGVNSGGAGGGQAETYKSEIYRLPAAMAPKQISQADLLSSLGPMLSPRSDTFTVRAYGESTNPLTGASTGRAWCEAVVQRVPDYVDQSDPSITTLGNATAPASLPATSINKVFGRKFTIVSFRWLSPADI